LLRRLLDSPWTYFTLAALLLVGGLLATMVRVNLPSRPKGTPQDLLALRERDDVNVLFILVDTLRADHLSSYGYERETSPTLDFAASSGVRFAHVQSQSSWTKASMASLWTGRYPRRTGVTRFPDAVPDEAVLPAERLREAGFKTGGIFRNGWVEANFGFDQGFDLYIRPQASRTPARFERKGPSVSVLEGTDRDATDSAMQFMRSNAKERFFLYVHYMDVHQYLYALESALFGADIRGAYDNAIHWTDRNVSALLATLDELEIADRTLVVVASDHGEGFYEHGLEGHARTLYREVTETPWILIPPVRLDPGIVVEEPVQNVDVWPTLLDLLGVPPLPDTDGRSVVPLMLAAGGVEPPSGTEDLRGRPAFSELDQTWGQALMEPRPLVAVVQDGYRLVRSMGDRDETELYDRANDPKEQRNVADREPERTAALRAQVEGYMNRKDGAFVAPQVEVDEMRQGQLRALGYMITN
jgi:arylsulfatase A-like enzyme